jgi:hypothetical protein
MYPVESVSDNITDEDYWLNFDPPVRLTAEEIEVGLGKDTRSILGRSGTGKTICIAARIDNDHKIFPNTNAVFVTRSKSLVLHVSSLVPEALHKSTTFEDLESFIQDISIACPPDPEAEEKPYPGILNGAKRKWVSTFMCTFPCFRDTIWPRIRSKFSNLDYMHVWAQIRCFIKGSVLAMTKMRPLTKEEYFSMKRKRDATDETIKEQVYSAYERYQEELNELGLWDSMDCTIAAFVAVSEGLTRDGEEFLRHFGKLFDRVYIDEVQDATQAEIGLMYTRPSPFPPSIGPTS